MQKLVKRLIITIITLIILLTALFSFVLFTTTGSELGLISAKFFLPKNIKIKYHKISGSLYKGINIDTIEIYSNKKNKIILAKNNNINLSFKDYILFAKFESDNILEIKNHYALNNFILKITHDFSQKVTHVITNSAKSTKSAYYNSKNTPVFIDVDIKLNKKNIKEQFEIYSFEIKDNKNNYLIIKNNSQNNYSLTGKLNTLLNNELFHLNFDSDLILNPKNSNSYNIIFNLKKVTFDNQKTNLITLRYNQESQNSNNNQIKYTANKVIINNICVNSLKNNLCLNGYYDLQKNNLSLNGLSKNITLKEIAQFLNIENLNKINFDAQNFLDFKINYNFNKQEFSDTKINLNIESGSLSIPNNARKYYVRKSNITANIINNALISNINFNLQNKDFIKANININNLLEIKNSKIKGELESNINDLTPIEALLPDTVNNLQGSLNCNYEINGYTNKISGNGACNLKDSSFVISNLNIKIIKLNLSSKIINHIVSFNGSLESENDVRKDLGIKGNGKLNITGTTDLSNNFNSDINIKGTNFLGENTISGILYLTPDINVKISPDSMTLDGQVLIPEGRIYANNGTSSLERKDVIFVGQATNGNSYQKVQNQNNFKVNGKLKLIISEKVQFEMKDFISNLMGNITFYFEDYIKTPLVTGVLELKNGVYTMYDQKLKITKGILNYINNPIDNPIASIQAEKTINFSGYNSSYNRAYVGISLTGPLGAPRLTLISNPFLPKEDILSYLIFGTPSQDAGQAQISILLKALQNVIGSTSNSESFLGSIFNIFKFDEIKMESINTTDPMGIPTQNDQILVLGKKITDKLFVRYGFSLLDPLGLFQAKYNFGDNWGFETNYNSFGELNADLIYFKESN